MKLVHRTGVMLAVFAVGCSTTNIYNLDAADAGAHDAATDASLGDSSAAIDAGSDGAVQDSPADALDSATADVVATDGPPLDASGPWGCLQVPPGASDPNATSDVGILVFDAFGTYTLGGAVDGGTDLQFVQGTVEPGVSVQACQALDSTCASSPVVVTDDAGVADFPATNGAFDGYYLEEQAGSFPALFYPGRVLASEPHMTFPTSLLPYTEAAGLGDAIGVTVSTSADAGVGHIFLLALDCTDHHASGVSFAISVDAGTAFYQVAGLPVTTPMATQTDNGGSGGVLNVPSGVVNVTATVVTENNLALPQYPVFVRSGAQTVVYVRPKSRPTQ